MSSRKATRRSHPHTSGAVQLGGGCHESEQARRLVNGLGDLTHPPSLAPAATPPALSVFQPVTHSTLLSNVSRVARHRRHLPAPVRREASGTGTLDVREQPDGPVG